ncbi:MAG: membrane protein insertion efficiency factor YidD [Alphaproteobacteria bacterium]|nr:MAG: membrane protein insertion efficiency factor YidD [Alphaproteobacteria bacterium]
MCDSISLGNLSHPYIRRGMKWIIIFPVRLYQTFISPIIGKNCRYTPTCSSYMITAVQTHGVTRGGWIGIKRFCKCHPFAKTHFEKTKGYDPVPLKRKEKHE